MPRYVQIVVLDDGETYSPLNGAEILTVDERLDWGDICSAREIPDGYIVSRITLTDTTPE